MVTIDVVIRHDLYDSQPLTLKAHLHVFLCTQYNNSAYEWILSNDQMNQILLHLVYYFLMQRMQLGG